MFAHLKHYFVIKRSIMDECTKYKDLALNIPELERDLTCKGKIYSWTCIFPMFRVFQILSFNSGPIIREKKHSLILLGSTAQFLVRL